MKRARSTKTINHTRTCFNYILVKIKRTWAAVKKIWKPCQSDTRYGFVYLYWNMSLQLPYHRYISENLISHVSSFFAFQISQDKNLLYLGSPRANATFNNSVESRTSATIFYSVSESNCFRIARAVTTKIWYINMLVRYIYSH